MSAVPDYSDGVVLLTEYVLGDLRAHLLGEDEETARRFGWWPEVSTEQSVLAAFEDWATSRRTGGSVHTFAVRLVDVDELVGGCQLHAQPDGSGEVSYWTGVGHRGNGYATRALRLLVGHASAVGVGRIGAEIAADNLASRAVVEAAGFMMAGEFDRDGVGHVRYTSEVAGDPGQLRAPAGRPGSAAPPVGHGANSRECARRATAARALGVAG
ncbi:GNAT family N-acetyltransferase [Pseudonocardia spinosispora]|uniref:GNAT family N-acetyltransferase n=1 Tax=Pseudonocardia spinosispora TaxID=103441 RepID=UPI00146FC0E1|nr:GNAT family protein [Pseudonocardia spinosispora]